jgi:hypothetical protein
LGWFEPGLKRPGIDGVKHPFGFLVAFMKGSAQGDRVFKAIEIG